MADTLIPARGRRAACPRCHRRTAAAPGAGLVAACLAGAWLAAAPPAAAGPVRVFIMAGQSNMQGKGRVENGVDNVPGALGSLRYLVDNDPATYGHLVNADETWVERSDVWIQYNTEQSPTTRPNILKRGNLSPEYGNLADPHPTYGWQFGPELAFGHAVGDAYDDQVLILKQAWGGKSLAVDFRPPSSGGTTGTYYTKMIDNVTNALANIGTSFPAYAGQGWRLEGFAWHQGWNDRVNDAYLAEYEANLANLIRDVRTDLSAPNLPFVIANSGMDPLASRTLAIIAAQGAVTDPVAYPEFVGNVALIDTRDFWREAAVSPLPDQPEHWYQNAESYYLVGAGLGTAMITTVPEPAAGIAAATAVILTLVAAGWRRLRRPGHRRRHGGGGSGGASSVRSA